MSETEERIERYEVRANDGWTDAAGSREMAERMAAEFNAAYPADGPHRVVHLVELRPGERIVREEEG